MSIEIASAQARLAAAEAAERYAQAQVINASTISEVLAKEVELNAASAEVTAAYNALLTAQAVQNAAQAGVFGVNALNNLNTVIGDAANSTYVSPNSYNIPSSSNASSNAAQAYARNISDSLNNYPQQTAAPSNGYSSSSPARPQCANNGGIPQSTSVATPTAAIRDIQDYTDSITNSVSGYADQFRPESDSDKRRPRKALTITTTTVRGGQSVTVQRPNQTYDPSSYPSEPRGSAGVFR